MSMQRQSSPITWWRNCRNTYRPDISISRHKAWGEQSGCRRELTERNAGIVDAYRQGVSLEELGDKYFLSVHAIRKIVYQK